MKGTEITQFDIVDEWTFFSNKCDRKDSEISHRRVNFSVNVGMFDKSFN